MTRFSRIALDGVVVAALFAVVTAWFTGSFSRRQIVAFAILVLVAVLTRSRHGNPVRRPRLSTTLVCGLGFFLRLPAFVEPAGFVGSDGSLQAILANVILEGDGPAPAFIETSSYQGSLKAHLGAVASLFVGSADLGLLVVIGSAVLWTLFTASTMALARRLGGEVPAIAAGLFVALSPRFATLFSVNNVGEYPDVLGLGTLALAWAAKLLAEETSGFEARTGFFGIGSLLGLAIWQQPIAVSFAIAALGPLALRAWFRRDPWFLATIPGLALGRFPVILHDFGAASTNSQAVGSFLRFAGKHLSLSEHIRGTLEWGFPIVFAGSSNDARWTDGLRMTVGLASAALVGIFLVRALLELRQAAKTRTWNLVRVMGAVSFLGTLASIWLIAGGGTYTRPRYFLPLLTGFALAFGDVALVLWRRSKLIGMGFVVFIVGSNTQSNVERLQSGLEEGRDLRALAGRIEQLGLKTGYSDVAVAGPLIMLTHERVSVDGVLTSSEGERLPARHVDRVRTQGPDFYLAAPDVAPDIERRLQALGVTYKSERKVQVLFYDLSRRVTLEEIQHGAPD